MPAPEREPAGRRGPEVPRLEGTAPGALDRALAMRGALEDTIGRSSTSCSR
ncbi:MAG: hypothetical protein JO206_12825, partial [Solirubrobacterales bacterium]|nr:hypothetical protein [Solirubrobacterales bacterium]MBV9473846.1 hypothetical protein [Solirubrobacterales bacterium]